MGEEETSAYLADFLTRVVARDQPFVSLVDARRLTSAPSAKVRRTIADWENLNAERGSRFNRGVVVVTESALVRGAMTALQWLSPPRVPTTYEATIEAGESWARARLAKGA